MPEPRGVARASACDDGDVLYDLADRALLNARTLLLVLDNRSRRDIKPHNIAIDHAHRKLRLIDWGLGECTAV